MTGPEGRCPAGHSIPEAAFDPKIGCVVLGCEHRVNDRRLPDDGGDCELPEIAADDAPVAGGEPLAVEPLEAELVVDGIPSAQARMLVSLVQRIEAIDDEIADLRGDRRDVRAEAKAVGFDLKALDALLRRRRMDPELRERLDDLVPLYEAVTGLPGLHGARPAVDAGTLAADRPLLAPPSKRATAKEEARREAVQLAALSRLARED